MDPVWITELLKTQPQLQVIVMTGKNAALRQVLASVEREYPDRLRAIGFTEDVASLMMAADLAITKPGGPAVVVRTPASPPLIRAKTSSERASSPRKGCSASFHASRKSERVIGSLLGLRPFVQRAGTFHDAPLYQLWQSGTLLATRLATLACPSDTP
jgi:hypothetical protein